MLIVGWYLWLYVLELLMYLGVAAGKAVNIYGFSLYDCALHVKSSIDLDYSLARPIQYIRVMQ